MNIVWHNHMINIDDKIVQFAEKDTAPSWRTLFYDFTQDTTLHGLRYVTLYSRYFIRR